MNDNFDLPAAQENFGSRLEDFVENATAEEFAEYREAVKSGEQSFVDPETGDLKEDFINTFFTDDEVALCDEIENLTDQELNHMKEAIKSDYVKEHRARTDEELMEQQRQERQEYADSRNNYINNMSSEDFEKMKNDVLAGKRVSLEPIQSKAEIQTETINEINDYIETEQRREATLQDVDQAASLLSYGNEINYYMGNVTSRYNELAYYLDNYQLDQGQYNSIVGEMQQLSGYYQQLEDMQDMNRLRTKQFLNMGGYYNG